jgi:hypothetical protein
MLLMPKMVRSVIWRDGPVLFGRKVGKSRSVDHRPYRFARIERLMRLRSIMFSFPKMFESYLTK